MPEVGKWRRLSVCIWLMIDGPLWQGAWSHMTAAGKNALSGMGEDSILGEGRL